MKDIQRDVSLAFQDASECLHTIVLTMRTFDGFLERLRFPSRFSNSIPMYCETPETLWRRRQELKPVTDYVFSWILADLESQTDILRSLPDRKPIPALLNFRTETQTHIEAILRVAEVVLSALNSVCHLAGGSSFAMLETREGFADECERAADRVRDYLPESAALNYLRRGLAAEEEASLRFFNPKQPDQNGPPPPNKLKVTTDDHPQIVLEDGNAIALKYDAAVYLEALIDFGDWMSDPEYKAKHGSENDRPERWRKQLPPEVLARIETDRRKGSRWRLA